MRSKRIKTLLELAGKPYREKGKTNQFAARYWRELPHIGKKFEREDGTTSIDKSRGLHSRVGKKESIRIANRSINKSARQLLKKQLKAEAEGEEA